MIPWLCLIAAGGAFTGFAGGKKEFGVISTGSPHSPVSALLDSTSDSWPIKQPAQVHQMVETMAWVSVGVAVLPCIAIIIYEIIYYVRFGRHQ
jgi:hypothetical protein